MSTMHTPEPWRACKEGECRCGQIWSIADDCPVATVISGEWGDEIPVIEINPDAPDVARATVKLSAYGAIPPDEAKANTKRIVACVNACKGIPTDKLREGVVGDLIAAARLAGGVVPAGGSGVYKYVDDGPLRALLKELET